MKVSWLRAALDGRAAICVDERCFRIELHAPHEVADTKQDQKKRGWRLDPFEPQVGGRAQVDSKGKRAWRGSDKADLREIKIGPEKRGSTGGLDHAIAMSVSSYRIKITSEIYDDVVNTYGSVTTRTVYRRLDRLVERGCVRHVRFGQMGGYLRATSKLLADVSYLHECLLDKMGDEHHRA